MAMGRCVGYLGTVLLGLGLGMSACGGRIAQDDPDAGDALPLPTATVPTSAPTDVPPAPTTEPTGTPKDTVWCGMPTGASLPYSNAAQLRDLLIGKWLYCEGVGRVGPTDVVGFEIDKERKWYFLRRASDGSLFRATGAGYQGYCVVIDLGHGNYQVDLDVDVGGGPLVTQTEFTDGPRRVHLHHRDGYAAYLRIPD